VGKGCGRDYLVQTVIPMPTCEPGATWVPPPGFWPSTMPGWTQLLTDELTAGVSPAFLIAASALAAGSPTTFGTVA
jgi:hypothetical protein